MNPPKHVLREIGLMVLAQALAQTMIESVPLDVLAALMGALVAAKKKETTLATAFRQVADYVEEKKDQPS